MKKSIWTVLFLLSIFLAFPLMSQAQVYPRGTWRAEYYDNPGLSGYPVIARTELSFGHDWGHGSPDAAIPADQFSARWTNTAFFEKGTYMFVLNVDDGVRVWLDGQLIIDAWSIGGKTSVKAKVLVDKDGDHQLQIAYFENTGLAAVDLKISQIAQGDDIVGAWVGQYYANANLQGAPMFVRNDGGINFNWDYNAPDPKLPRDNFSIRWTRTVYLRGGEYTFRVQHDDGMRLYVNGKIVYDSWKDQVVSNNSGAVTLPEGVHTFTVEFYDHLGYAIAQVWWDQDPGHYDDLTPPDETITTVDNDSQQFTWVGQDPYIIEKGGYGNNYFWIPNIGGNAVSVGRWTPSLAEAGNYEVMVYVPMVKATALAYYKIQHSGQASSRELSQNRYGGEWVSLGIYYFSGGTSEYVALANVTGEPEGASAVAYDAVRFIKRPPPPKPRQ